MDKDTHQFAAESVAQFLKSLANGHRLLILCHLLDGERSVGQLEKSIASLRQSALSQHLARLRTDGLVQTRREGQMIFYRLATPAVEQTLALMRDLFCPTVPLPLPERNDDAQELDQHCHRTDDRH